MRGCLFILVSDEAEDRPVFAPCMLPKSSFGGGSANMTDD